MTYATAVAAIETYLRAEYSTPANIFVDGHKFEPSPGTDQVLMRINDNGASFDDSVGRSTNRVGYIGVAQFVIYTASGKGKKTATDIADEIMNIFRRKVLDDAGAVITDPADAFIRFSPSRGKVGNAQHPYKAAEQVAEPHLLTTVNAPFVRYEYQ